LQKLVGSRRDSQTIQETEVNREAVPRSPRSPPISDGARSLMPMKHKDCEERNEPATLTERGLAAIQSPCKPNDLSHCIFECLIVEASSQAQNHLSVLANRYTKRCRGVFNCTGDGQCDNFGSGWTRWPRHFGMGS